MKQSWLQAVQAVKQVKLQNLSKLGLLDLDINFSRGAVVMMMHQGVQERHGGFITLGMLDVYQLKRVRRRKVSSSNEKIVNII